MEITLSFYRECGSHSYFSVNATNLTAVNPQAKHIIRASCCESFFLLCSCFSFPVYSQLISRLHVALGVSMEGPLSKWTNMVSHMLVPFDELCKFRSTDGNIVGSSLKKMLLSTIRQERKCRKDSREVWRLLLLKFCFCLGCMRLKGAIVGIDGENNSLFTLTSEGKVFHLQVTSFSGLCHRNVNY